MSGHPTPYSAVKIGANSISLQIAIDRALREHFAVRQVGGSEIWEYGASQARKAMFDMLREIGAWQGKDAV